MSWFSCGAASAVASKLMLDKYGPDLTHLVYCDVLSSEHPDNARFMRDVEQWLGRRVTIVGSPKYVDVDDVFDRTRYMAGVSGARCTTELKKLSRREFERPGDIHTFGYTVEEKSRIEHFEINNPELVCDWVLADARITKADCYAIVADAGIEIPLMYKLGYDHNNCLGCVKATSANYWNQIRRDFPDVFDRRARQSREIGCKLTRVRGERVYLHELPQDYLPADEPKEDLSCGPSCAYQPTLFGEMT